jgi:hypothetical protein
MDALDVSRHQSIERLASSHQTEAADLTDRLWRPLATQIIAIVGVGGFDSLYARSVYLTQQRFSWLAAGCETPSDDSRFANLAASLNSVAPELARAANHLLLTTFTDVFASLVGAPLTARILDSAWGTETEHTQDKDKK